MKCRWLHNKTAINTDTPIPSNESIKKAIGTAVGIFNFRTNLKWSLSNGGLPSVDITNDIKINITAALNVRGNTYSSKRKCFF